MSEVVVFRTAQSFQIETRNVQFRQQTFLHMSSLVSNHGSLTITAIFVHRVYVLDQFTEDFGFLEMFSLEGLIGQSTYLPYHEIHSSFVFVAQVLARPKSAGRVPGGPR